MKLHLVCYATKNFELKQRRLIEQAKQHSVDVIHSFNEDDLHNTEFYKNNKQILDQQKGAGYWLWQTYFINKVLLSLNDEDVLLYIDSGLEISSNLKELVESFNFKDALFFYYSNYIEKCYTKRDCFVLMDCDSPSYWNQNHSVGGFHIWKNTTFSRQFIQHILLYSQDQRLATDLDNVMELPNFEGFIVHRHLQSIISLLTRKLNAEIVDIKWTYPTIIFKGDARYKNVVKEPLQQKNALMFLTYKLKVFLSKIFGYRKRHRD